MVQGVEGRRCRRIDLQMAGQTRRLIRRHSHRIDTSFDHSFIRNALTTPYPKLGLMASLCLRKGVYHSHIDIHLRDTSLVHSLYVSCTTRTPPPTPLGSPL